MPRLKGSKFDGLYRVVKGLPNNGDTIKVKGCSSCPGSETAHLMDSRYVLKCRLTLALAIAPGKGELRPLARVVEVFDESLVNVGSHTVTDTPTWCPLKKGPLCVELDR